MGNQENKREELIKKEIINKEEEPKYVPIHENEIKFINMNTFKNQKFEDDDSDYKKLLDIKKNNLIYEFDALKKEIEKKKSIFDLNDIDDIKENNYYSNKDIIQKDCCCCESSTFIEWNFKFIGPLFVIFSLVGVYQLINILKATQNEMIFGIKSFLLENITRHNNNTDNKIKIIDNITMFDSINATDSTNITSEIMHNFENLCFQNLPDFNLMFLTSGIGNIFLNFCGYRLSTIIFVAINCLIVFLYQLMDFPEEKYSDIYSLIFIISYFLLLFISVGGISLFAQQIFFDGLRKYMNLKNYDKEISKNITFFHYLCSTSIIAYIIYLGINYILREYLYENYFIINIYLFLSFFGVSIIIYCIYSISFINIEKTVNNNSKNGLKNIYRMCGYLIYCQTKSLKNNENIGDESKKNEKNNDNEELKDDENKKVDEKDENVENRKDDEKDIKDKEDENKKEDEKDKEDENKEINNKNEKISDKRLEMFKTNDINEIVNCENNKECNLIDVNSTNNVEEKEISCVSCKLSLKKFFRGIENSGILSLIFLCDGDKLYNDHLPRGLEELNCDICDLGNLPFCLMDSCDCEDKCDCCCQCCDDVYCCSKFCKIWYIFWAMFICVLLSPFCFCCYCDALCGDNKANELHQDEEQLCYCYKVQRKGSWFCDLLFKNDLFEIIMINIFLELLIIGFEKQIEINLQDNTINKNFIMIIIYSIFFFVLALLNLIKCLDNKEKKIESDIYRLTGLTIWNCFIVTILSGFSLFGSDNLKDFTNKYLILIPYALTKFYYFILINSLVKDLDSDNFDLLSNSTMISLFLLIYKIIAWIFTDFLGLNIDALYLFQFIFGFIVSIFILTLIFYVVMIWCIVIITCYWIVLLCKCKCEKPKKKVKKKKFFFNK